VKTAVWDCDGSKSPGPDGINFNFLKQSWHIIKDDIMRAVRKFHKFGLWPKGTNASFITLIPKVENPQKLDVYRPISLVGCIYKIVAKLLANRLKLALKSVIDTKQSTFLENRGLLDSVIVANEVLDEVKKKKRVMCGV